MSFRTLRRTQGKLHEKSFFSGSRHSLRIEKAKRSMAVMRPIFELIVAIVLIVTLANPSASQERRAKARISNGRFHDYGIAALGG